MSWASSSASTTVRCARERPDPALAGGVLRVLGSASPSAEDVRIIVIAKKVLAAAHRRVGDDRAADDRAAVDVDLEDRLHVVIGIGDGLLRLAHHIQNARGGIDFSRKRNATVLDPIIGSLVRADSTVIAFGRDTSP